MSVRRAVAVGKSRASQLRKPYVEARASALLVALMFNIWRTRALYNIGPAVGSLLWSCFCQISCFVLRRIRPSYYYVLKVLDNPEM